MNHLPIVIFANMKGKVPRPNWLIALTKSKDTKFKDFARHMAIMFDDNEIIQMSPSKGRHVLTLTEFKEKYDMLKCYEVNQVDPTCIRNSLDIVYPDGTKYDQKGIVYYTWRVTAKIFLGWKVNPKHGQNKWHKKEKAMCQELFDCIAMHLKWYLNIYNKSHAMVTPGELNHRLSLWPEHFKPIEI